MSGKTRKKGSGEHWLLVLSNNQNRHGRYNLQMIFDARIKCKAWGLPKKCSFQKMMAATHKVIFYVGKPYCAFAGIAILSTGHNAFDKKLQNVLRRSEFHRVAKQGVRIEKFVRFDIQVPVPLIAMTQTLPLIKKPEKWETALQGAVRALTQEDFEKIVRAAANLSRGNKQKKLLTLTDKNVTIKRVNGLDQDRVTLH